MTVASYVNRFETLPRGTREGIINEEHEAWLFEKDLKIANEEEIVATQSMSYTQAVGQALALEGGINETHSLTIQNYKMKQSQCGSSRNVKRKHNHKSYN